MTVPNQKVVLITGASSGIGRATAHRLSQAGFHVFGTSRKPHAGENQSGNRIVRLDVQSDKSVTAAVDTVLDQTGRVDILINNAGYALNGALEETTVEETRRQFETNFFGGVRLVKAVLPTMRKQGSGQIINVSSLVGLVPIPFMGVYSASKFALEGYTEALRYEVNALNIRVSLVEPGFIQTNFARNSHTPATTINDYGLPRHKTFEAVQKLMAKAPPAALVAETVERIISAKSPRLRYLIGKDATLVATLRRLAPQAIFERIWRTNFNLNGTRTASSATAVLNR